MDALHGLSILISLVAVLKLYSWCQMCYWCSPECREDWKPVQAHRERNILTIKDHKERQDA